jgi:transcriptional regulator with XRE-family HTH domain
MLRDIRLLTPIRKNGKICGSQQGKYRGRGNPDMSEERPVADTHLARWLNHQMAEWEDPKTGRRGLSVNRLAKLSRVSQTSVFEILKEGTIPKAETLVKFAEFFEVSPMTLFRLVYAPETEERGFPPEIRAKLVEFEDILKNVPDTMQLQFLESLVLQARMLLVAAEQWQNGEMVEESHSTDQS